jgi:photosystem II stability/assembly factor-like uncharacterized protein
VTVGERGHVLVSDDGGHSFRQQPAPTRATLTAVYFLDREHGVAVGHDEVILHTSDGGEHWTRVHFAPQTQQPFLNVWFGAGAAGYAVGAYSTLFESRDGGAAWAAQEFAPQRAQPQVAGAGDSDEGVTQPHLYALVAGPGTRLYIAAEAGHLYRSDDTGASWRELGSPYAGSFFGLLTLAGDSLLAFGLRGHVFRSDDGGATWAALDSHTNALLSGAARLRDGTVLIVGLSGVVLVSHDARTFRLHQEADRRGFSAVAPADDAGDAVVLVGEAGVRRLTRAELER